MRDFLAETLVFGLLGIGLAGFLVPFFTAVTKEHKEHHNLLISVFALPAVLLDRVTGGLLFSVVGWIAQPRKRTLK